jgi:hypothetical protein
MAHSSLLQPSGEMFPNSFIAHAASRMGISLCIGCMCNPGGAAALLGLEGAMEQLYVGKIQLAFSAESRQIRLFPAPIRLL